MSILSQNSIWHSIDFVLSENGMIYYLVCPFCKHIQEKYIKHKLNNLGKVKSTCNKCNKPFTDDLFNFKNYE